MAPVRDPNNVDDEIKSVIQHLFDLQSAVHGFLPETKDVLVDKITELTHSLADLKKLSASPNSSINGIELPPEILDYVDGTRNPDVYTREFVELVQRGNAVLNGKQEAFKGFSEVFESELLGAMPGMESNVVKVMKNAGLTANPPDKSKMENGDGRGG